MDKDVIIRLRPGTSSSLDLPGVLKGAGTSSAKQFDSRNKDPGVHLLLKGDRDYYVVLKAVPPASVGAILGAASGKAVYVIFPGRKPVRRLLSGLSGIAPKPTGEAPTPVTPPSGAAIDLNAGLSGAAALYLFADGQLGSTPASPAKEGELLTTLQTAARWVSSRRKSTFERLFPPSAFHPEEEVRKEALSLAQADGLLFQIRGALSFADVSSSYAKAQPQEAAQIRSASVTVLSHILATVLAEPGYRKVADTASAEIFGVIDREVGETARPALRAHAIQLLSIRGPALSPADRDRATTLLRSLVRMSPPYAELTGPWNFAACSAWDFHEGECDVLKGRHGFVEIPAPEGSPAAPRSRYTVLEAPFRTPQGEPIRIFARSADPRDENLEMGVAYFTGTVISRHAQLGSFDMTAATVGVNQVGYKLMMNTQCAGLTTRFAISKMFPDADIYSSWDSTYFNTDSSGKVTTSEGMDCFVALLQGMSKGETHSQIEERIKEVQWYHKAANVPGFVQFVGPSNPQVVGKFNDVNQDGKADFYDGFLDFFIKAISEDMKASSTPKDPGVSASQIGGDAAQGLGWAAGSMNRVVQYADLWSGLPGATELLYPFHAGGFYSHKEPPRDIPVGKVPLKQNLGKLPALCHYIKQDGGGAAIRVEVMFHSHLSHAAEELKRLLCSADAMWRAIDLGYLPRRGLLDKQVGQRGFLLLMMAGLLEFPSDQNFIDGLWSMALSMLALPPISRSVVRACITEEDHDASNYYGSLRGLAQLVGVDGSGGALKKADPVAFEKICAEDPQIGRAKELELS